MTTQDIAADIYRRNVEGRIIRPMFRRQQVDGLFLGHDSGFDIYLSPSRQKFNVRFDNDAMSYITLRAGETLAFISRAVCGGALPRNRSVQIRAIASVVLQNWRDNNVLPEATMVRGAPAVAREEVAAASPSPPDEVDEYVDDEDTDQDEWDEALRGYEVYGDPTNAQRAAANRPVEAAASSSPNPPDGRAIAAARVREAAIALIDALLELTT